MLKKSKAIKSAVAMLAAMSMVSGVVFAATDTTDTTVIVGDQKYVNNTTTTDKARVDVSTGASVMITPDASHNTYPDTNGDGKPDVPDNLKNHATQDTARVIIRGERTDFGLNAFAGKTGTAVGAHTTAGATNSIAIGAGSSSGVGSTVEKGADGGIAIGADSTVTAAGKNSVALGVGSVADKANTVSFGSAEQQRTLSNVADGALTADSHDVVTGRQLFQTNSRVQTLGKEVDSVGALSAALAGLHPLDYTGTGSKVSVATAVGNYDGKKALAVGGFYNFSPDAMMSLGASMSFSGDKKYAENLGFTFRVGEGASTAPAGHHDEMADRFVAMEQAISELKAQNEALSQQVTAVEQENKDLKAKVGTLQK